MLSVGVSLNGGFRLLERALRMRAEAFGKAVVEGVLAALPTAAEAKAAVATPAAGLRIARTTLPDQRPDFNQTFRHIHQELKALYAQPQAGALAAAGSQAAVTGGSTLKVYEAFLQQGVARASASGSGQAPADRKPAKAGLKIARTTLPDEPLDFNQTFRHIHNALKPARRPAADSF